MRDAQPRAIQLKDYQVPEYLIDTTDLIVDLFEDLALVTSQLTMRRNPESKLKNAPLALHGQDMEIISIAIDDKLLSTSDYTVAVESLTIDLVPESFTLHCVTRIKPQENTSLEGLYKSKKMFCTQCESEGFRKITYYLDRPDVMSSFSTKIIADREKYPVLLSNGNEIERGEAETGRHWVKWQDPFKKPSYLFALVAGDLKYIEDHFVTCSGRDVLIRIFVEAKDIDKCDHAMTSLKNAMRWDEEVYGREYDLDIFMIVAVDDFNMGAMENKGLNIFNTSCVLAKPETTTDAGFQRVEAVVAHEYFHNWSGNRVTCRDWFQLSLKEGFTVFRDAEFSADMGSRTVKRVEDVSMLRTAQFAEDAGPMAHPIRPSSYIEISNFYTLTVYEKGAEVVRMIYNILGEESFRQGSDLYFERHDGQAVTTDDFVQAMEDASGVDLSLFRNWYSQAGTPVVNISDTYDENARTYTLSITQSCPPTPECQEKQPFHIPLAMGLLGDAGALRLKLRGAELNPETSDNTHLVLNITKAQEDFVFEDVPEKPVPSLFRGFSAPVRMHYPYQRDDLLFLMTHDEDGFARWDASQQLATQIILEQIIQHQQGKTLKVDERLLTAFRGLLEDTMLDKAMVALMFTLPSEAYLSEISAVVDVDAIHQVREFVRVQIAQNLQQELLSTYESNLADGPYAATSEAIAQRSLKNVCLAYLMLLQDDAINQLCRKQYDSANNMTDVLAAMTFIVNSQDSKIDTVRQEVLSHFYDRWQDESLVVNQWLMVQAMCQKPQTLQVVLQLMKHPCFDIKNPNKIRSLIGAFCASNAINFHNDDGSGYKFLADQILILDKSNSQVASRLCTPLTKWKKYGENRQTLMREQLTRIISESKLSKDVYEVVSKSLV